MKILGAITKEKARYRFRKLFVLPPGLVPSHAFNPVVWIMQYIWMIVDIAFDAFNNFFSTTSDMFAAITRKCLDYLELI